jgi:sn-glycerol 3-phosphate transport system ATP-binding protein
MRIEIKRLQRTLRTTSVYVTHDQLEAMTLADRLVVMNAGRIEQVGTPIELYEKPATVFVAGFIGSPPMNFIDLASLTPEIRAQLGASANGGDLLGIRPDAVSFNSPVAAAATLSGTVELIEPVGAECHIHLRWNNQLLVAEYRGRPPFTEASKQPFFLDRAAMHFFDKATGARR